MDCLRVEKDRHHAEAKRRYEQLTRAGAEFYTSDYVLAEAYTRLIYDVHLRAADILCQRVEAAVEKRQLVVLEIDPTERELAWQHLRKYSDHKLSFTDATIIANFKEFRLDEIFTFDRHFHEIGLPTNLGK